jgi:hypothetical protein
MNHGVGWVPEEFEEGDFLSDWSFGIRFMLSIADTKFRKRSNYAPSVAVRQALALRNFPVLRRI